MGLIRVIAGFQKKAPPHPLPPAHPDCSLNIAYAQAVTGDWGAVPLGLCCRVVLTLSCANVLQGGSGQWTVSRSGL